MRIHRAFAVLALLAVATPVAAASFDCAKAGTRVEKLVCADPDLGALDERLSAAFKALGEEQTGNEWGRRAPRSDDQRRWLREVRDRCADTACLRKAYSERLAVLVAWHAPVKADRSIAGQYSVSTRIGVVSDADSPEQVDASDCLSIVPRDDGAFDLAIESLQTNAHTCSFRGQVRADGSVFRGIPGSGAEDPSLDEGEVPCNVSVLVERGELRVETEGTCSFYCGARAHLEGLVFLRDSRAPGPAAACPDPYADQ
jgi:uncharacterized protein